MKYLLLALMLSGCMYQTTNITDIMKAQKFCLGRGGILHIKANFLGVEHISCIDGSSMVTNKVKL